MKRREFITPRSGTAAVPIYRPLGFCKRSCGKSAEVARVET
jgi:hypothetical protein